MVSDRQYSCMSWPTTLQPFNSMSLRNFCGLSISRTSTSCMATGLFLLWSLNTHDWKPRNGPWRVFGLGGGKAFCIYTLYRWLNCEYSAIDQGAKPEDNWNVILSYKLGCTHLQVYIESMICNIYHKPSLAHLKWNSFAMYGAPHCRHTLNVAVDRSGFVGCHSAS